MKNGFFETTKKGLAEYITQREFIISYDVQHRGTFQRREARNTTSYGQILEKLSGSISPKINIILGIKEDLLEIYIPERKYYVMTRYADRSNDYVCSFGFDFDNLLIKEKVNLSTFIKDVEGFGIFENFIADKIKETIKKDIKEIFKSKKLDNGKKWILMSSNLNCLNFKFKIKYHTN